LDVETCGSDVANLLAMLGVSPAILIGHGLGCRVTLEAARREPDAVMGVVLIDGDRHVAGDPDAAVREARDRYEATGFGQFRDTLLRGMFPAGTGSTHKAEIIERARQVPTSVAEAYWCSILRWDAAAVEGALRSLRVPLLVLQSTYLTAGYKHFAVDPRMVTPWLEVIGRVVPTVRIQIIGGIGHFPMLDAADAVNRCITTFLADATFRRFFESA
jgi:pimeloyl-ACP methyl ester carboxylesterase